MSKCEPEPYEPLTDTCSQCGQTYAVDPDEPRADGRWTCDICVRTVVNRAASPSPLAVYIFETAVEMAKVRR